MKQLNNEVIICPFLLPQYDILLKDWSELLSLLLKQETRNTKFHRHFCDLFHWQLWKVDVNYSLTFPSFSRPFFTNHPFLTLSLPGLPLLSTYHVWECCCVYLVETGLWAVALCPHDAPLWLASPLRPATTFTVPGKHACPRCLTASR